MIVSNYLLWIELIPCTIWDKVHKKRSNVKEAKYKYACHPSDNNLEDNTKTTIYDNHLILRHDTMIASLYLTYQENYSFLKIVPQLLISQIEVEKAVVKIEKISWELCGRRVFVRKRIGILVEIETYNA